MIPLYAPSVAESSTCAYRTESRGGVFSAPSAAVAEVDDSPLTKGGTLCASVLAALPQTRRKRSRDEDALVLSTSLTDEGGPRRTFGCRILAGARMWPLAAHVLWPTSGHHRRAVGYVDKSAKAPSGRPDGGTAHHVRAGDHPQDRQALGLTIPRPSSSGERGDR